MIGMLIELPNRENKKNTTPIVGDSCPIYPSTQEHHGFSRGCQALDAGLLNQTGLMKYSLLRLAVSAQSNGCRLVEHDKGYHRLARGTP